MTEENRSIIKIYKQKSEEIKFLTILHTAIANHLKSWIKNQTKYYKNQIHIQTPGLDTPLIYAINLDSDIEIIKALLENGANPNQISLNGLIPLQIALLKRRNNIFELLLDFGADINQRFLHGHTTLSAALKQNNLDLAKSLIKKGARFYLIGENVLKDLKEKDSSSDILSLLYLQSFRELHEVGNNLRLPLVYEYKK